MPPTGHKKPNAKGVRITIRIEKSLHDHLLLHSRTRHLTVGEVVRRCLKEHLGSVPNAG